MEISGLYGMNPMFDITMTEEQKTTLAEILSKYDAEDFSAQDKRDLRDELVEAGIPRCRDAMQLIREAGLDLRPDRQDKDSGLGIGQYGMQKGELWDYYMQLQNGDITEEEFLSLIKQGTSAGSLFSLKF